MSNARILDLIGKRIRGSIGEPWDFVSEAGENVIFGEIVDLHVGPRKDWVLLNVLPFESDGVKVTQVFAVARYTGEELVSDLISGNSVPCGFQYSLGEKLSRDDIVKIVDENLSTGGGLIGSLSLFGELNFEEAVRDCFRFLEDDYGFYIVKEGIYCVSYEKGDVFVNIYRNRLSYEIEFYCGIFLDGKVCSYLFSELLIGVEEDVSDIQTVFQSSTKEGVLYSLGCISEVVKKMFCPFLTGDVEAYKRVEELRSKQIELSEKERSDQILRDEAEKAWQAKDYERVKEIYSKLHGGSYKLRREEIIGKWILRDGDVVADKNVEKIKCLIQSELKKVSDYSDGWKSLYMDKQGGYWEHTYLESHLHGGGPPSLIPLSKEKAKKKYDV